MPARNIVMSEKTASGLEQKVAGDNWAPVVGYQIDLTADGTLWSVPMLDSPMAWLAFVAQGPTRPLQVSS